MDDSSRTVKLAVTGMTCAGCKSRIEGKLRKTEGVRKAKVDWRTGGAVVSYDPGVTGKGAIIQAIEELGYRVAGGGVTGTGTLRAPALLAVILAAHAALSRTGLLNLLSFGGADDAALGAGMLFAAGLMASVHCTAMCGGIVLSQCVPAPDPTGEKRTLASVLKPALLYNLGRVVSYTVTGAVLGLAGMVFGAGFGVWLPVSAQGILKIAAGVFMVSSGIGMLGIFPRSSVLSPRMPGFITRAASKGRQAGKGPFVVGLLNGLMPCGPLQSVQLAALASGGPAAGALSMLAFSLGTVPLMTGLGSAASLLTGGARRKFAGAGAVTVAVMGLAMISQGGSLSGLFSPETLTLLAAALCAAGAAAAVTTGKGTKKAVSALCAGAAAVSLAFAWNSWTGGQAGTDGASGSRIGGGRQTVESTVAPGRLPSITVQASTPVSWIITAPEGSLTGCNYKINIREFGIDGYTLKTGENVIEFTPEKAGQYQYTCWMGMIRARITVTEPEDPEGVSGTGSAPVPGAP